jgi:excisionase family DNA binding protein
VIAIDTEKNYLSVTEAAEMLGLQRARTGVLCRKGRFPGAVKVGNSWIIPREAVLNHKPLPPGVKPRKAKLAAEKAAILEAAKGTKEE